MLRVEVNKIHKLLSDRLPPGRSLLALTLDGGSAWAWIHWRERRDLAPEGVVLKELKPSGSVLEVELWVRGLREAVGQALVLGSERRKVALIAPSGESIATMDVSAEPVTEPRKSVDLAVLHTDWEEGLKVEGARQRKRGKVALDPPWPAGAKAIELRRGSKEVMLSQGEGESCEHATLPLSMLPVMRYKLVTTRTDKGGEVSIAARLDADPTDMGNRDGIAHLERVDLELRLETDFPAPESSHWIPSQVIVSAAGSDFSVTRNSATGQAKSKSAEIIPWCLVQSSRKDKRPARATIAIYEEQRELFMELKNWQGFSLATARGEIPMHTPGWSEPFHIDFAGQLQSRPRVRVRVRRWGASSGWRAGWKHPSEAGLARLAGSMAGLQSALEAERRHTLGVPTAAKQGESSTSERERRLEEAVADLRRELSQDEGVSSEYLRLQEAHNSLKQRFNELEPSAKSTNEARQNALRLDGLARSIAQQLRESAMDLDAKRSAEKRAQYAERVLGLIRQGDVAFARAVYRAGQRHSK